MSKKSLITSDMINLVKSVVSTADIEKVVFDECRAFTIGKVTMSRGNTRGVTVYTDDSFDNDYRDVWKNDVGEILRKELHKEFPELYILKDSKFKALLKKISEDELDLFKENGFDHIKIGDNNYTLIRIVKPNLLFSHKDDYNDYHIEPKLESYIIEDDENEVEDENVKSTELF